MPSTRGHKTQPGVFASLSLILGKGKGDGRGMGLWTGNPEIMIRKYCRFWFISELLCLVHIRQEGV